MYGYVSDVGKVKKKFCYHFDTILESVPL